MGLGRAQEPALLIRPRCCHQTPAIPTERPGPLFIFHVGPHDLFCFFFTSDSIRLSIHLSTNIPAAICLSTRLSLHLSSVPSPSLSLKHSRHPFSRAFAHAWKALCPALHRGPFHPSPCPQPSSFAPSCVTHHRSYSYCWLAVSHPTRPLAPEGTVSALLSAISLSLAQYLAHIGAQKIAVQ